MYRILNERDTLRRNYARDNEYAEYGDTAYNGQQSIDSHSSESMNIHSQESINTHILELSDSHNAESMNRGSQQS